MPYPTMEERLEAIMHDRGFTGTYAFSRSLGRGPSWYSRFLDSRKKKEQIRYGTACGTAERLGLIPAIIHRMDRTPLFGESVEHFRTPVNYQYLRFAYVGDVLHEERPKKGFSQRGLSKHIGMPLAIINQCENYRRTPLANRIQAICKALDLEVEWLAEPIV